MSAPAEPTLGQLFQAGRFQEVLDRAAAHGRPERLSAPVLNLLAIAAIRLGQDDLAESYLRTAIAQHPQQPDAYSNLGNLHRNRGQTAAAEAAYRRAIELHPQHPDALTNLGVTLLNAGRIDEAASFCRRATECAPTHANAWNNLAAVLLEQRDYVAAEHAASQAISANPRLLDALSNLAAALKNQGRFADARAACQRALALDPAHVGALNNLGNAFQQEGAFAQAEAVFRAGLARDPEHVEMRWNHALSLLALGDYAAAWPRYEIRYSPKRKERHAVPPPFATRQWQGESLQGQTLLIWPEQGFGDQIQCIRFAPLLKSHCGAARIVVRCKPALAALMASQPAVDDVVTSDEAPPRHDCWTFPFSIAGHLGVTLENLPAELPYLFASAARIAHWQPRLPARPPRCLRVGLVWKGSSLHRNDAQRSLPGLAALAPLWSLPDIRFVSLQKGQGEDEAQSPPPGQALLHLGSEIHDFADSAAIVAQFDLVICVDTAIAHLAGALGKPCWVLLPAIGSDWRWLTARDDSPWYPGVLRLFRQAADEDWSAVIARVTLALKSLNRCD